MARLLDDGDVDQPKKNEGFFAQENIFYVFPQLGVLILTQPGRIFFWSFSK